MILDPKTIYNSSSIDISLFSDIIYFRGKFIKEIFMIFSDIIKNASSYFRKLYLIQKAKFFFITGFYNKEYLITQYISKFILSEIVLRNTENMSDIENFLFEHKKNKLLQKIDIIEKASGHFDRINSREKITLLFDYIASSNLYLQKLYMEKVISEVELSNSENKAERIDENTKKISFIVKKLCNFGLIKNDLYDKFILLDNFSETKINKNDLKSIAVTLHSSFIDYIIIYLNDLKKKGLEIDEKEINFFRKLVTNTYSKFDIKPVFRENNFLHTERYIR